MLNLPSWGKNRLGAVRLISTNEPSRYSHTFHTYFRQIP
jgi:hypothetical protein